MPRVTFVKKARKDNPVCKAGESYYWWKFRYGGKRYSLTPPRQSQLTQSPYFGAVYSMQESIEDAATEDWDSLSGLMDDIKGQIEELRDETQGSLDNMPDELQYSPTGELLQERIDALDGAESEIDCIEEWDEDEPQESEYEESCPECDGTGEDQSEDAEMDSACVVCDGSGDWFNEDQYQEELSSWEERQYDAIQNAREEMFSALDNCIV